MDGFFLMTFAGAATSGFGILVLRDGSVVGADVGGIIYDGTYTEDPETKKISVEVTISAPAGAAPVQTGVPLVAPISVPITATLTQADILTEKTILLQTPLGPVNIIFKKIRDFPRAA